MILSGLRARSGGNMEGDGTLLGASLVLGPGDQGIVFQYQASEFGDHAPLQNITAAVDSITSDKLMVKI